MSKKLIPGVNDLATVNPKLASEWHPYKNGDLKPTEVLCGAKKKAWWLGQCGHEWEADICHRASTKKPGCPYCANQKVLPGFNDLSTTDPHLACEWDYDKNTMLPQEITRGSNKIVWWICPACNNSYDKSPNKRISGQNCPYCSGKKVKVGYNDLETWCKNNDRYDLIKEFDCQKNDFSMTEITAGNGKKVWWICPNGHSYQATLHHRLKMGTGCGICSHKVFLSGENDLLTTNPEIAKEWDYEKNKVNPSEVMVGSNKNKYWFICPKGHSYNATLLNRKKGTNCPWCDKERHISFPEKAVFYYIKKSFENVIENYHDGFLGRKEIDIYLPDLKVGIEYDGRAWHKNSQNDLNKDNACKKAGITLIRIREYGSAEYNSSAIKKYITSYDMDELNDAIIFIFTEINRLFGLNKTQDIDVERDRVLITNEMSLFEKDNSLVNFCPEINDYWDSERNGNTTPNAISYGSGKRIYLQCSFGHRWDMIAKDFPSHPWCPICRGYRVVSGINDLFTTNPELITQWSPNNTLDPHAIKAGCISKALWICDKCGYEYDKSVRDKVRGAGCPYCSNKRVKRGYNDISTTNPELLEYWDYKNNGNYKPEDFTNGSNKRISWVCPCCGNKWELQILKMVKRQNKCQYCKTKQSG